MRRSGPLEYLLVLVDLGIAVQLLRNADTAYLRGYLQGHLDADLAALRRQVDELTARPAVASRRRWR